MLLTCSLLTQLVATWGYSFLLPPSKVYWDVLLRLNWVIIFHEKVKYLFKYLFKIKYGFMRFANNCILLWFTSYIFGIYLIYINQRKHANRDTNQHLTGYYLTALTSSLCLIQVAQIADIRNLEFNHFGWQFLRDLSLCLAWEDFGIWQEELG